MTLSTAQIEQMQKIANDLMRDTCVVQTPTTSADSYGELIATYTDGSAISCGFQYLVGAERVTAELKTLVVDAEVRLPIGTSVASNCRVKLTKQNGVTLSTALVFEIVGPIRQGAACLVLALRRVSP